jgi:hypothetical protein
MPADSRRIVDAMTDQEVLDLLTAELERRVDSALHDDLDAFVAALQRLPDGFRAMAATYQLDVSIALDDLGWHFGNWHHHGYAAETARGLRTLGATRAAELFEAAYALALPYWDELGRDDWMKWYQRPCPLEAAVTPLNNQMWALLSDKLKVMKYWVDYARQHPDILSRWGTG